MKGNALNIVRKLRNVRFQPPNGGPKEKLAFINRGEADLLRSIGGSGKRTKYGVPSFAYDFSKTSSGQGNWNTGGARTGTGSMGGGITGTSSRYDVAPTRTGNPKNDAAVTAAWQQSISARDARLSPQRNGRPAAQPSQAPVVQPAAIATALPAIPTGMNFANASLPVPATPSTFPARPSVISSNVPNVSQPRTVAGMNFAPVGNYSGRQGEVMRPTSSATPRAPTSSENAGSWSGYDQPASVDQSSVVRHLAMGKPFQGYRPSKAVKDQSRLPGMTGATPPTPAYNPGLVPIVTKDQSRLPGMTGATPQMLNDIRHNGGWIPDPVDTPRPMTPSRKGFTKSEMFRRGIVNDAQHRSSQLNKSRMSRDY